MTYKSMLHHSLAILIAAITCMGAQAFTVIIRTYQDDLIVCYSSDTVDDSQIAKSIELYLQENNLLPDGFNGLSILTAEEAHAEYRVLRLAQFFSGNGLLKKEWFLENLANYLTKSLPDSTPPSLLAALRKVLPDYCGSETNRGLLEYGWIGPEPAAHPQAWPFDLWSELYRLGSNGRVLDSGCGNCVFALELYRRFNINRQLGLGSTKFKYLPEQSPCYEWGHELPEIVYRRNQKLIEHFKEKMSLLQGVPPHYVGVTSYALERMIIENNAQIFSNPRVRVLTGRLFSQIADSELLVDGEGFDLIVDVRGVITYTSTLYHDVDKMLRLLKVGGKLLVKTERSPVVYDENPYTGVGRIIRGSRIIFRDENSVLSLLGWLQCATGIRVIVAHELSNALHFVLEKTQEHVLLPPIRPDTFRQDFEDIPCYRFVPHLNQVLPDPYEA